MKKIAAFVFALSFNIQSSCYANVNTLITDALNGDSNSQLELAKYYEQKDYKALMFQWYEKAAEQGNIQAQEILAYKFFNSGEVDKAFSLAKKLSENGNEVGKSILAYYYCWGAYNIPVDKNLALKLANETSNNSLSKAVLANYYLNGFWGVKKDVDKALKLANESFDEGCLEGGCIHNRIVELADIKNDTRYEEINEKLSQGDYIDGILNTSWEIAFSKKRNSSLAVKNIEPFLNSKSGYPYYLLAKIEEKINRDRANEYINKSAELWFELSIFDSFKVNLSRARYKGNDFQKIKELVELAIKTKQTNLIGKLYFLLVEADSKYRISKEAMPENIDWGKIVKECADNGHPVFMLIHAYNLGKDNKEYSKYINQAAEMGAIRVIPDCTRYCEDKKKWYELGAELKHPKYLACVGSGKLKGFYKYDYRGNKIEFNIDKEKGLEYLEAAAKLGDTHSAYELFEYYSKDIKIISNEVRKLMAKLRKDNDDAKKNENLNDNQKDTKSEIASNSTEEINEVDKKKFDKLKKKFFFMNLVDADKMESNLKEDKVDLETYKKAYFWGIVSEASDSKNTRNKKLMDYIQTKVSPEEIKEIADKAAKMKEEIELESRKREEKRKKLEENYIPLEEMEFLVIR